MTDSTSHNRLKGKRMNQESKKWKPLAADKLKKVVIFTTNIKDQEKIKEEINSSDPNKKCLVLNRPNKMDDEKISWDYLMKNGVLPPGTDVLLMNKVAQAGININDKDIDVVLLVGKFDPYGFLQYLGRCRNYRKSFYFLYHDYGAQANLFTDADEYQDYINTMEQIIDLFKDSDDHDFSRIKTLFGNRFTETVNGKIELNKCMLVNDKYKDFTELNGDTFIKFLPKFDPTLEIADHYIFDGVDSSINKSKKRRHRKNLLNKIPGQIKKYAGYINPMVDYLSIEMKYVDALQLILRSKPAKNEAKKDGVLYIPGTRVNGIKKLFKNAQEIGIGVPKIVVAAKKYIDKGKNEKFIDNVLDESNPKIVRVLKAFLFFHQQLDTEPLVQATIEDLENEVGEVKTKNEWMSWIKSKVNGMPGEDQYAKTIYNCCCKIKDVHRVINGDRKKVKKLEKVLRTYPEFIQEHDLDDIF